MRPNPTRVAIDELQLHDLQKADAAVPPATGQRGTYRIDRHPGELTHEDHAAGA
jgi:hypothetical protein